MTTPIDKLPHPSTVPIPAACLFRWRGKRPAEIRAAIFWYLDDQLAKSSAAPAPFKTTATPGRDYKLAEVVR